jgi:hypothetical protein
MRLNGSYLWNRLHSMISINPIGHGIDMNELHRWNLTCFIRHGYLLSMHLRKRTLCKYRTFTRDRWGRGTNQTIQNTLQACSLAHYLAWSDKADNARTCSESTSNSGQINHSISCAMISIIQYISILIELFLPPFMCTFSPKYSRRNLHLSRSKQRIQSMSRNTIPCRRKRHPCISHINTILQRSLQ